MRRVVGEGLGMGRGRGWRRQRASGAKWCLRGWPLVSWLPWLHSVSREALAPLFFARATRITEHQDGALAIWTRAGYSMGSGKASAGRVQQEVGRSQRLEGRCRGLVQHAWMRGDVWGGQASWALDAPGMGWRWDGVEMGWDGAWGRRAQWMQADQQMVGSLPHCSLFGLLTKRRTRPVALDGRGCTNKWVPEHLQSPARVAARALRPRRSALVSAALAPPWTPVCCPRLLSAGRSRASSRTRSLVAASAAKPS